MHVASKKTAVPIAVAEPRLALKISGKIARQKTAKIIIITLAIRYMPIMPAG
jgi:hypothetical protein